jgi:hypothetical protein
MKEKPRRFNFKVPSEEIEILNFLETQFKLHKGSKTEALLQIFKDSIASDMTIMNLEGKIKELENNGFENKATSLNGRQALSEATTEKPFDYENWYSDCEYGTYFKDKKQVHCRCTYPSVKKWLPRNRMVDPQVCDNCFPRIQGIKDFINTQREEKKALAHTERYFTNEYGTRIPY